MIPSKKLGRYRRAGLRALPIIGVILLAIYFFQVFTLWGKVTESTSQAVAVLLTINIPELRQNKFNLHFGSQTEGCNVFALEHCAVLQIKDEILNYPKYLERMRQILEHVCDYAISPNEPAARQEDLLRNTPNDPWLKRHLQHGEPAWHKFACDQRGSHSGPSKIVLNVYRLDPEKRNVEVGSLAHEGKQVLQLTLYVH